MEYKIGLIGCGHVGQGFLQVLHKKAEWLKTVRQFEAKVVAICDKFKGSLIVREGINLERLLYLLSQNKRIDDYDPAQRENQLDPLDMMEKVELDIIIEATPTDIRTAEPATSYIRKSFRTGKHVVTSNKGPAALHYHELIRLARQNHLFFRIEGTVMSGTPVFSLFESGLSGNSVLEVKGILNGTTNFILTCMEEEDMSYEEALRKAQQLGYAETDPTADVEGLDALAKVLILSNVIFGHQLQPEEVERQGITHLSVADIKQAKTQNQRIKLVARVWREGETIKAKVAPEALPLSDPLSRVMGVQNGLVFNLDILDQVMIQGPGAGEKETGYALLNDLLFIHENLKWRRSF